MFWLGIQGYNGAQAMGIMIGSIWPSFWPYYTTKNTMAADAGVTTGGMIAYIIFWIVQLPLLLIPPTKLQYLFLCKLIFAPITAFAMLGWCVHKAGGSGELFNLQPTVSGSTKAYLWLSCMSSVTGVWATLAVSHPCQCYATSS